VWTPKDPPHKRDSASADSVVLLWCHLPDALDEVECRQHHHFLAHGFDAEQPVILELAEDVGEMVGDNYLGRSARSPSRRPAVAASILR
jgi:hypothetical protein